MYLLYGKAVSIILSAFGIVSLDLFGDMKDTVFCNTKKLINSCISQVAKQIC